jgi:uncharacterized membrane protein
MTVTLSSPARRAQRATLLGCALIAIALAVAAGRAADWPWTLGLLAVYLAPLVPPLAGLARGTRRTYAWATLCLTPYVLVGLTEVVANPRARVAAACLLFASLATFVAMLWFLRVTRDHADRLPPGRPGPA